MLKPFTPMARDIYQRLTTPPVPNLKGDRDIENSWVAASMPQGPGIALNFGSGSSILSIIAARKGYNVTAVDLLRVSWDYIHPQLQFVQGDLMDMDISDGYFDLIINCSVVEHVGVVGRYVGTALADDGDLRAMHMLARIIKPGKPMILTIPIGQDAVFRPYHRVYGEQRLPKLLSDWTIVQQEFWGKKSGNIWEQVSKDEGLMTRPQDHYYGLGLFVLTHE